jgi:hypothetical protein
MGAQERSLQTLKQRGDRLEKPDRESCKRSDECVEAARLIWPVTSRVTYNGAAFEPESSADHLKEAAVRMPHWIILCSAAILVMTPAAAQTYGRAYPVCLQKWQWGGSTYYECAYTSWDQCRTSAIGLAAMCVENPYRTHAQPRVSGGRARSPAPY